jgi:hypothetical protein
LEVLRISRHLHGLKVEPLDKRVEKETRYDQKNRDGDVGDRGCEVCPDFPFADCPDVVHCPVPPEITLR